MNKGQLLNNFYVSHSVWISQCAYNLVGDHEKKDDLIQDTFIKLMDLNEDRFEKILFGPNDLNTFFFYQVMKNHNINQIKKNKEDVVDEEFDLDIEDDSVSEFKEQKLRILTDSINSYLDAMEKDNVLWFSAKLFRVYLDEGHTYDSLAAKTGISRSTIFTSIKNIRLHLKDVFASQYADVYEDEY